MLDDEKIAMKGFLVLEVALLRALQKNFFSKSLCKKEICCGQGDSLFIAIVKKDNECKKAMESCNLFRNLAYYLD